MNPGVTAAPCVRPAHRSAGAPGNPGKVVPRCSGCVSVPCVDAAPHGSGSPNAQIQSNRFSSATRSGRTVAHGSRYGEGRDPTFLNGRAARKIVGTAVAQRESHLPSYDDGLLPVTQLPTWHGEPLPPTGALASAGAGRDPARGPEQREPREPGSTSMPVPGQRA